MWFWIKHLSLAFILILAAAYFLFGKGPLVKISQQENAAARGLSQFYAGIKNKINDKSQEREKYVIDLKLPSTDLEAVLEERAKVVQPSSPRWIGSTKSRRFSAGSTLKKVMSDYALEEDIALYWYLDKDYVIKHQFRVEASFISTLYQVGKAIDSDFEYEVQTFFCHNERSAIITEKPSVYVREHCRKLSS